MPHFDSVDLIVVNPGASNEVRISGTEGVVQLLEASASKRSGDAAPRFSFRALDKTAQTWRKVTFGANVRYYVNGTVVFAGTVVTTRPDAAGGSVLMDVECVGRTALLYRQVVAAETLWLDKTTGTIVKDLIDVNAPGLTSTNVTTTTGVTVSEFIANANDNVGDLIEKLAKLDGHTYDVDENDDVHYFAISATSQLIITEEDLDGGPGERPIETGVMPPRNKVRIIGSDGYLVTRRQETHDATFTLDASTKYVGQRFQAQTNRLSGVALHFDWTDRNVKPNSLTFEVRTEAKQTRNAPTDVTPGAGTAFRLDGAGDRFARVYTVPAGNPEDVYIDTVTFYIGKVGAPSNPTIEVRLADGSDNPTTLVHTLTPTLVDTVEVTWAASGVDLSKPLTAGTKYAFILLPGGTADASNYYSVDPATTSTAGVSRTSTDSGSTYASAGYNGMGGHTLISTVPSATKVVWSDDVTLSAGDVPYPPAFSSLKTWSGDKLALVQGSYYWLVVRDASPGASKWMPGYSATTDSMSGLKSVSSTDSGTTWSQLGKDLAHKLYFSSDTVDVTVTDATSIASYGTWPYEENIPSITSSADATAAANAIIARFKNPSVRMTLPLKVPRPELTPRAVVTVNRPLLGIAADYEVAEVRTETKEGRTRTTVLVGTREFNAARALADVHKKTG